MPFSRPIPDLHLPKSVQPQNKNYKCLYCSEEFSDLDNLDIHNKIHNSANKDNNENDQIQNNELVNNSDMNTTEWDDNIDQPENNCKEMEIKLEITNIVTLKDQMDCTLDNINSNEDFTIRERLENLIPIIEESSEQECIVNNNELLKNYSELIPNVRTNDAHDEANTRVDLDEKSVVVGQVENKENDEVDVSETKAETIENNSDSDKNTLAKEMLLKTD